MLQFCINSFLVKVFLNVIFQNEIFFENMKLQSFKILNLRNISFLIVFISSCNGHHRTDPSHRRKAVQPV